MQVVKEADFQFYFNISPAFSNVKLGYTLIYSVAALRSTFRKEAGYFGIKFFRALLSVLRGPCSCEEVKNS